jgi:hypothetical protein
MRTKTLISAILLLLLFTNCDKKDNGGDNGGPSVPDPAGTITANISEDNSQFVDVTFTGDFSPSIWEINIEWNTPDNIYLYWYSSIYYRYINKIEMYYHYDADIKMVDIGAVAGLGNVRQIPSVGWGNDFACEQGHGYVIKIQGNSVSKGRYLYRNDDDVQITPSDPDYWEETQYIRLYVVEPIISTDGGIMGAKIKYQYPFNP